MANDIFYILGFIVFLGFLFYLVKFKTDWILKFLGIKRNITLIPRDDQQLSSAIEKERGQLLGEALRSKKESEKYKKELELMQESKESGVAKNLQERKKEMSKDELRGSFDLRRFIDNMNKLGNKRKIRVLSFDMKTVFGYFNTLLVTPKGMIVLMIETEKGVEKLIGGTRINHIFRNPGGLSKLADNKVLVVNLDSEGRFIEDPLQEEIPDLIIDAKGKFNFSRIDKEPFLDRYIEVRNELSDAHSHIETLEKTLSKQIRNENLLKHNLKIAESRAESSETELTQNIESMRRVHSSFGDATNKIVILSQQLETYKNMKEGLEVVLSKVTKKLEEAQSMTRIETGKSVIEDAMNIIESFKPQPIPVQVINTDFERKIESTKQREIPRTQT